MLNGDGVMVIVIRGDFYDDDDYDCDMRDFDDDDDD